MTTLRPASGPQSDNFAALAPPIEVVPILPGNNRGTASAFFSPSVTITDVSGNASSSGRL
jgi:hypothetical protein